MYDSFKYVNVNPEGRIEGDCVTRAICLGTGLKYELITKMLDAIAYEYDCDKRELFCYEKLIHLLRCETIPVDYDITIEEFAYRHRYGVYLVRVNGHMSTVIDGIVNDTWDCRDRIVTNAWRVI